MLSLQLRGGAVRQLVGLITQRSLVQIRPPLLTESRGYGSGCNPFFVPGVHIGVQLSDRGPLIVRSEMGLAHGHFNVFVAKEFFDRHKVDAGHHEVRGKGVSEIMEDKPCYPRFYECPAELFPNVD
jgi:hypothetical protein